MNLIQSSNGLNPYLELISPSGNLIASDDDSGGSPNALMSNIILPESGQYKIRAQGYSFKTTGSYSIILTIN